MQNLWADSLEVRCAWGLGLRGSDQPDLLSVIDGPQP